WRRRRLWTIVTHPRSIGSLSRSVHDDTDGAVLRRRARPRGAVAERARAARGQPRRRRTRRTACRAPGIGAARAASRGGIERHAGRCQHADPRGRRIGAAAAGERRLTRPAGPPGPPPHPPAARTLTLATALKLEIHPATPARWPDLVALFGPRGACAGCWCMWPRLEAAAFRRGSGAGNRRALQRL